MVELVQIKNVDSVYNQVISNPGIIKELSDTMTFMVPNYWHTPAYKRGGWNGSINLLSSGGQFYYGLNYLVEQFCKARDYQLEFLSDFSQSELSVVEAQNFIRDLNLALDVRDYQLNTFISCVRNNRALVLSPTASGKSLIIYLLARYYNMKTLIIVPQTSLVHQMATDFESYEQRYDNVQRIFSGQPKNVTEHFVVSTWQSIYKFPASWFSQFGVIIGDEAHLFKATSLTTIMKKTTNVEYKFGFTGTLDDSVTHKYVLEGVFGPVISVTSTAALMKKDFLAQLKIKCIELKYDDEHRKHVIKYDYQGEIDWLIGHERRNDFIKNLTLSLKGNSLVLFRYVDKHGVPLYNKIKSEAKVPVYFVSGQVEGQIREDIRKIVDQNAESIIVASLGVFSTGTNIINLDNIVLATPVKSKIKVLQSIGRGLRRSDRKKICTLIDIADDLSWKNKKNFTISHYKERVSIYIKEGFSYKTFQVKLKG